MISGNAISQTEDAAEVFSHYIEEFEKENYEHLKCQDKLSKSWDRFSGSTTQYPQLETAHLKNTNQAVACGIIRGTLLSLLLVGLGEIKKE